MPEYHAPLDDMRFLYEELGDTSVLRECPGFADTTPDLVGAVLEEAAKLAESELAPLNRVGDEHGCVLEDGVVRTPPGFREAYRAFVEGGWGTLTCRPEHGGQGLPETVGILVEEIFCAANMAFSMYPGLTRGAYAALERHGDDALKALYLPRLATGEWSGTMCLTEPQCGTDLGLVRTRAVPREDGTYAVTGQKIFISAGEHDLSENIVHLVLARLPDAPEGTRGISLFLVPKLLPDDNGAPGVRNAVLCTGLEHKMGIRASATCALQFEEATGWLVGAPNRGMHAMFTMMNAARLGVGVQGLAIAEAALQGAAAYARERLQGRALKGPRFPELPADPIVVHPDVRRMLLTMRAWTEGARALGVWVAAELDAARHHPDPDRRQAAEEFVALMTPVVKAFFTDAGFEAANLGVQVYGGHGYIREHGMEQLVRDGRITQIYEGTNGIQALDLVGRKLPAHMGRSLRRFFHPVDRWLAEHADDRELAPFVEPLGKAFSRLQRATARIVERGTNDPDEAGAAATDYLRLFGYVAVGYMWARMAEHSMRSLAAEPRSPRAPFFEAKLGTARFYMERMLPFSSAHFAALMSGGGSIMEFPDRAFGVE